MEKGSRKSISTNQNEKQFQRFEIGTVHSGAKLEQFWTNIALAHENQTLQNEKLLSMPDEQLEEIAFTKDGFVNFEFYHRPHDHSVAEKQGGVPDEVYMGVHRAYVVLQYRTATKSAIFERNRKSMTAEQELEYDKHASYDLLKGLRKFCLKNPDAKIAKAMYDSKLAAYKRRFGLEENETVELIKKEFCNI